MPDAATALLFNAVAIGMVAMLAMAGTAATC